MKKFCITFFLFFIIIMTAVFGTRGTPEYLRIHIRANSNADSDQAVKYEVRDAIVAYLAPTVSACETKADAMRALSLRLPEIETIAERVLGAYGLFYGARASLKREEFPTRVYETVTLEAGVYDALILELGAGAGDNWWCVVYPPLCFTADKVTYRSKILEWIRGLT